jgi:uncharacterized protein YecE (DUF72 family)
MHFGEIQDLKQLNSIDFSLPDINLVSKATSQETGKFYFGAPAWGEKSWIGSIYPKGTKPTDFLKYYSQTFNNIELNTSFYRVPTIEDINLWKSKVDSRFKFSPKFPKQISHLGGMNNKSLVTEFIERVRLFEQKLGVIFLQLNESFGANRVKELANLVSFLPKDLSFAFEFRHPSWFPLKNNLLESMANHNISTIITDVAGRRDIIHSNITSNQVFIRFVGNALHPSDFKRLDVWIVRIHEFLDLGLDVYFNIHEPDEITTPDIVMYLKGKYPELLDFNE